MLCCTQKVLQKALGCRKLNVDFTIFPGEHVSGPPWYGVPIRQAVVACDAYLG